MVLEWLLCEGSSHVVLEWLLCEGSSHVVLEWLLCEGRVALVRRYDEYDFNGVMALI